MHYKNNLFSKTTFKIIGVNIWSFTRRILIICTLSIDPWCLVHLLLSIQMYVLVLNINYKNYSIEYVKSKCGVTNHLTQIQKNLTFVFWVVSKSCKPIINKNADISAFITVSYQSFTHFLFIYSFIV